MVGPGKEFRWRKESLLHKCGERKQEPFLKQQDNQQPFDELNKMFQYICPQLHKLYFQRYSNNTAGNIFVFDNNLMDKIIRLCTKLQKLDIYSISLQFIDHTLQPNSTIQSIQFHEHCKYEDGFFEKLSKLVPNLDRLSLTADIVSIKKQSNYNINMESTNFPKLKVTLKIQEGWDEQEVILVISTKDNDVLMDRYYHCRSNKRHSLETLKILHKSTHNDNCFSIEPSTSVKSLV
jgi:hypothetical protein